MTTYVFALLSNLNFIIIWKKSIWLSNIQRKKASIRNSHSLASFERCSSHAFNVSSCMLIIFLECSYVAIVLNEIHKSGTLKDDAYSGNWELWSPDLAFLFLPETAHLEVGKFCLFIKYMKKVKGKRPSFSGRFLFLSSIHSGCMHIFIWDDLASLCRNLGAVMDGLGKLWIWEWFEYLSSGCWLSEHKVKFRDPKSTPQKKFRMRLVFFVTE